MSTKDYQKRERLMERANESLATLKSYGLADLDDGELADLVYLLREHERRVASIRKDLETELPDVATGSHARTWMASTGYTYSFNNQRLVADTIDKTADAFTAFRLLIDTGVMRFSNRITSVEALYRELDTPLIVVPHEIEEGDPDAHVGKYPKPKIRKFGLAGEEK